MNNKKLYEKGNKLINEKKYEGAIPNLSEVIKSEPKQTGQGYLKYIWKKHF